MLRLQQHLRFVVSSIQQRFYSPQKKIDSQTLNVSARSDWIQKSDKLPRLRKAALNRFRLTRFGWQHRRARLNTGEKRGLRRYLRTRHSSIGWVHQRDFKTLEKYFPHLRIVPRSSPLGDNVNLLNARLCLPAHLG
jgi:hypothetical protein